jgi:hypothetical protein
LSSEYGKNPSRHPDSTLAGETLLDVNKSLEQWLCRLADTCPLDELRPLSQQEGSGEGEGEGGEVGLEDGGGEGEGKGHKSSKELKRKKKKENLELRLQSQPPHSSSLSVLESIYQMSGITENDTPIPPRPRKGREGEEQGVGGGQENLIQKLVVSNHKTKTLRPPTQSLGAKTLPNRIYVPK